MLTIVVCLDCSSASLNASFAALSFNILVIENKGIDGRLLLCMISMTFNVLACLEVRFSTALIVRHVRSLVIGVKESLQSSHQAFFRSRGLHKFPNNP